jgi:hypothetical protein
MKSKLGVKQQVVCLVPAYCSSRRDTRGSHATPSQIAHDGAESARVEVLCMKSAGITIRNDMTWESDQTLPQETSQNQHAVYTSKLCFGAARIPS